MIDFWIFPLSTIWGAYHGHGLLGLGDEYSNGYLLDDKELKSLNLSSVEDPEKIKWRQLLGFRNTYTCRNAYGSKMLVSSYECIMRDTNYQFCEVCRLQGFKRMSQLVKDVDLYVATPEVKEYTGAYSKPSDFTDLETSSYYNYTYNRNDRLLSGNSKSRFNTNMNGKKIELRTVIQNISDKNARQLKFKMWIKHSDGSVATDSSGNPLQTVQTFDIPVWNDKANFWPLGALDHIKSDFNSGLKSCSLIYQIPSDAQLKSGDTVAFQVLDENGNVLADDNTETQRYTTVSIQYKFEDGSEIPNTAGGTFTVPYGTKLDLTPAKTLYDYEFIKVDGLNKPIVSDGTVVTYYYKNKNEEHTHNLTLVAAKAATCTTAGNSAYYTCDGCDKWFADATGSVEITDKTSVKIPAPGHTAGTEWKSDDTNHWHECSRCHDKNDEAAHSTSEWIIDTAATETAEGAKHKECTVCKKVLETATIPATGSSHTNSYGVYVGMTYTAGNLIYQITSIDTATVGQSKVIGVVAAKKNKIKKVTIPDRADCKGYRLNVTTIGNNAFAGCKALEKLTIGNKVTVIGKNAFKNCSKLETVVIGKAVKTISSKAFIGDNKIKKITFKGDKLKTVKKNAFSKKAKKNIKSKKTKLKGNKKAIKLFKKKLKIK